MINLTTAVQESFSLGHLCQGAFNLRKDKNGYEMQGIVR